MDAAPLETSATTIFAKGRDGDFVDLAGEGVACRIESTKVGRADRSRRSGFPFRPNRTDGSCLAFCARRRGGTDRTCFPLRPGRAALTLRAGRSRRTSFAALTFDSLGPCRPLCARFALRASGAGRSAWSLSASGALRACRALRPGWTRGTLLR
jgi:hypothetical protein